MTRLQRPPAAEGSGCGCSEKCREFQAHERPLGAPSRAGQHISGSHACYHCATGAPGSGEEPRSCHSPVGPRPGVQAVGLSHVLSCLVSGLLYTQNH